MVLNCPKWHLFVLNVLSCHQVKSCFFLSKESIVKVEILQPFKTVDSNFSFASANGNGQLFREMFPNSDIAKGYKQSKMKIKYSIQLV